MKWNPIFQKETKASARSFRVPLLITVFNSILSIAALFNMYSVMEQVKMTAEVRYSSFLELYIFVASIEFILIIFLMPSITAGSISGERERRTLDLMLTTNMSTEQIIMGKMMASLQTVLLLLVSSLPVLALVFVYGGVDGKDLILLLGYFAVTALFIGSMGLCFSALFGKTMLSSVVTYAATLILVAGTYAFNRFFYSMTQFGQSSYGMIQDTAPKAGAGCYLLLLNPAVTFYVLINKQAGSNRVMEQFERHFGVLQAEWIGQHWVGISVILQIVLSILFLKLAAYAIEPVKQKRQRES